jgi:hypothetical protein
MRKNRKYRAGFEVMTAMAMQRCSEISCSVAWRKFTEEEKYMA